MDGYTPARSSLLHLLRITVSQADACVLRVRVLNVSRSPDGGHKVKVRGGGAAAAHAMEGR